VADGESRANRVVRRGGCGRAQPCVASLVLAVSLISPACASHTRKTASGATSRVSSAIAAKRIAGLRIAPETSYRRTLDYFVRAGQHGSSSFTDGLCELRFETIGLSTTFMTLAEGAATPAKCTFFMMAVVTGSRWHTPNGLRVGAPLETMRRLFPRAYRAAKIAGEHRDITTGSTEWWLANHESAVRGLSHAARPVLAAYVKDGHVAALGVTIVGH
jgi:hypothetical protein